MCRYDVQRRCCLWKSFRAHRENHSGQCETLFAFPPESLFTFSPESFSSSPRNAFHVSPGIPFALPRNPHTIENETETAFILFNLYEELHRSALKDSSIFAALNADARFWTGYRSSIQANLFMTLSRLFDKTSGATTIQRLLTITKTNPHLFSFASLSARKMGRSGVKPGWLDGYMTSVWIPTGPADFGNLQATLTPLVMTFHDVYIPIRDSVYAHRLMSDAKAGIDLFPKTSTNELGEIVDFSQDLLHCLRNLFDNGHEPILGKFDLTKARKEARKTLESVLRKVVAQNR